MNKKIFRKRNIGRYFLWSLHLVSVALWFCSVSFLESRLRGVTHLLFPQSNHTTFKCVLLPFVKLYEPLVYFCTWSKLLIVSLSVCCHFFHVLVITGFSMPCNHDMEGFESLSDPWRYAVWGNSPWQGLPADNWKKCPSQN